MLLDATQNLEQATDLDTAADTVAETVRTLLPPGQARDLLQGEQFGHPLHAALVSLPIGLQAGAILLDFGGEQHRAAATRLVGIALLATPLTALTGLVDYSRLASPEARRVGLVHAALNGTATVLFAGSWLARRRGHHRTGRVLSLLGATELTVGAYLGGHLTYRFGAGVDPS